MDEYSGQVNFWERYESGDKRTKMELLSGTYRNPGVADKMLKDVLALADKTGVQSVRIQNSDLTDLLQFQSKGGIRFLEQSTPSSPDKGLLFYDTSDAKFKAWNGGEWKVIQYE